MSTENDVSGITGPFFGGFVEQVINPVAFPVTITLNANGASLSWPAQAGALFYRVWCGLSQLNMRKVADHLLNTAYQVTGLNEPSQYFYQVTAIMAPRSSTASLVQTPNVPATGLAYAGFVPVQAPTAANIIAMAQQSNTGFAGTYDLTQSGLSENYPCFAFPASFGIPNQFVFGGFPYGMQETQVTINGVLYNVFVSPFQTFSSFMQWIVS